MISYRQMVEDLLVAEPDTQTIPKYECCCASVIGHVVLQPAREMSTPVNNHQTLLNHN